MPNPPHEDIVPYQRIAIEPWENVVSTVDAGTILLTGRCRRCHGTTTRTVEIVVQGATPIAEAAKKAGRFTVECECQHIHANKPAAAEPGCGAFWFASTKDAD